MLRVTVGLRQEHFILPCLFELVLYRGVVTTETYTRVMGRAVGLEYNGHEWEINKLRVADTVITGVTAGIFQELINESGAVCRRRKFKPNVFKSKVMVALRIEDMPWM